MKQKQTKIKQQAAVVFLDILNEKNAKGKNSKGITSMILLKKYIISSDLKKDIAYIIKIVSKRKKCEEEEYCKILFCS